LIIGNAARPGFVRFRQQIYVLVTRIAIWRTSMRLPIVSLVALLVIGLVQEAPAKIVHRWSFTTDASDSVGKANAKLNAGAKVADGKLTFNGDNGFAEVPVGGTLSKLKSVTVE